MLKNAIQSSCQYPNLQKKFKQRNQSLKRNRRLFAATNRIELNIF